GKSNRMSRQLPGRDRPSPAPVAVCRPLPASSTPQNASTARSAPVSGPGDRRPSPSLVGPEAFAERSLAVPASRPSQGANDPAATVAPHARRLVPSPPAPNAADTPLPIGRTPTTAFAATGGRSRSPRRDAPLAASSQAPQAATRSPLEGEQ